HTTTYSFGCFGNQEISLSLIISSMYFSVCNTRKGLFLDLKCCFIFIAYPPYSYCYKYTDKSLCLYISVDKMFLKINWGKAMMWNAGFKWMFLIIGTTIGAGYASGRELWEFFGHESGLAIFLFIIFFTVCCIVIMEISYRKQSS